MKDWRLHCCLMMALLLASAWAAAPRLTPKAEAAQTMKTAPLYSFISSKNYRLYKIGSDVLPGLTGGPWKNLGIVAHVMPQQVSGTKPVYQLLKSDIYGVRFAYTSDPTEANKWKGGPPDKNGIGQWMNQGPVFYVASVQTPATVPLYRLYMPTRIAGDTSSGGFSGLEAGTDTHFYTIKAGEKTNATNNGWVYEGIVGYVWKEPHPPAAADLVIQDTTADDSSVKVIYANKGTASASHPDFKISLSIFDRTGKLIFSTSKITGGVSAGSAREVVIPTGNVSLRNSRYQVKIDSGDVIDESNENNNETAMLDGPKGIMINQSADSSGRLRAPSIAVTGTRDVPPRLGKPHMAYRVSVHNWDQYPSEFFQSTKGKLPPNPCGDTRMQARVIIFKGNQSFKMECKALNTPQDLQTVEIASTPLDDTDQIEVMLIDRLTNESYRSQRFTVGWYGLGELLKTVGCKSFLGRAGQYLCATDQGFNACENLRQQGKPIQCTKAGKQ